MNPHLMNHIDTKLNDAAEFVIKNIPISMDTDAIYEGLIGEPHVAKAFSDASKYLVPSALSRRCNVKLDHRELVLNVRLQPTEKYPVFLMPHYPLVVNSASDLGRALALPVRVATEWEMLKLAWSAMRNIVPIEPLAIVMPWLQELFRDFELHHLHANVKLKKEQEQILREVRAFVRGRVPDRFPRLTNRINRVCASGRTLLSQYRMLEAVHKPDRSEARVTIVSIADPLPDWFAIELLEVMHDWDEEEQARLKLEITRDGELDGRN